MEWRENSNLLREGMMAHFTPGELLSLGRVRVGIAGAGGLGSNVAMLLARSGVEKMLIIDHDMVEPSNLNRQHFWPRHVGRPKVDCLAESLLELNPDMEIQLAPMKLSAQNSPIMVREASIWAEALDAAESKAKFVQDALEAGCRVASASGLCGLGGAPMRKLKIGNLTLVGDFQTSIEMAPPLAPRVAQAAALMADAILEFILEKGQERKA